MNFYDNLLNSTSFVSGFTLEGDGRGTAVSPVTDSSKPLWLHFDYSGADCIDQLVQLGVPEPAIDSLIRVDTRPRAAVIRGGMLLILRGVNLNPGDAPEDMVSLRCWLEKNRIITVRQRRIQATQDIRAELEKGTGPASIQDLTFSIIERIASHIADYVDNLEEKIELHEDIVATGNVETMRRDIAMIRRDAAAVRRYLAPQRDALDSFHRQARDFLNENAIAFIPEQSDRIMRYVEDLDLVREKVLVLQEELLHRVAREQSSRMYVLSIIAAIFLPLSFITGLFGMNVADLPGLQTSGAFWFVMCFLLFVTGGILLWFRHKHWL